MNALIHNAKGRIFANMINTQWSFPFARINAELEFSTDEMNGRFPSLLFRSGLSKHINRLSCFCHKNDKKHFDSCIYRKLLEPTLSDMNQSDLISTQEIPRPFVIYCSQVNRKVCNLTITVFGYGVSYAGYIMASLLRMGNEGLSSDQIKFSIRNIKQGNLNLWDQEQQMISESPKIEKLQDIQLKPLIIGNYYLNLLSPLCMTQNGKALNEFNLKLVLKNIVRRLDFLSACYGEGYNKTESLALNQMIDQSLCEAKGQSNTIQKNRYSNRQHINIDIGGIIGDYLISNLNEKELELLQMGQYFHVGKKTTFGNGCYQITIEK